MAENGVSGTVAPVYQLGNVSYGDESRIEVNPTAKETQDGAVRGLEKRNRKWTIHGHPLKDGKIYTGRQYFSSTDILDEYVRVRDTNEPAVQFVVFPHQQTDTNTGKKVIHNRCRILIFPDSNTIMQAMAESSRDVIPKLSRENGFNKNASDGSLKNEAEPIGSLSKKHWVRKATWVSWTLKERKTVLKMQMVVLSLRY